MLLLHLGIKPFRREGDVTELLEQHVRRIRAECARDLLEHLEHGAYDIVFIDHDSLAGPSDGIITAIRRAKIKVPLFIFTALLDTKLKIRLLDLGADEVLTSPCPIGELLARARAIIRRLDGYETSKLALGPLALMMDTREVTLCGKALRISPIEYLFLELLVRRRGAPVSKSACLAYLYTGRDEPNLKMIDVVACRLRKKLEVLGFQDLIQNVWGHGFKLDPDVPRSHPAGGSICELRGRSKKGDAASGEVHSSS